MNSIMKKLSCLMLIVCCFTFAIANNVDYSKKIKGALTVEQITSEAPKTALKAP